MINRGRKIKRNIKIWKNLMSKNIILYKNEINYTKLKLDIKNEQLYIGNVIIKNIKKKFTNIRNSIVIKIKKEYKKKGNRIILPIEIKF